MRHAPTDVRPVLLATLAVPIAAEAERVAIAAALESGADLIVVNVVWLPPFPTTVMLVGPAGTSLPHEDGVGLVRETAERAAALAVRTQHLRVSSPHPVRALLEVVAEQRPGLLVFGPDPGHIKRRKLRAAGRRLTDEANCLVWSIATA